MKSKFGTLLIVLGLVLIASALGLFFHNSRQQQHAAEAAEVVLPQVVEAINQRQEEKQADDLAVAVTVPAMPELEETVKEMTVVEIDGYGYIGFLSIPSLEMEWPVMADWSDEQLKISPCRFYGDANTDDLVIMAHNFTRFFSKLNKLREGESVYFTDMDGTCTEYAVVARDLLDPNAVEEMTSGDYDLTLFTCTYGGASRVTVRCDVVESE